MENIQDFSLIERLKICLSITKLVGLYHNEGYLCLDIKPSNIFILNETTEIVEFVDFDSVREIDTIAFGNSMSFTKSWAAPEQENPYSVDCISKATDIYAIGEIVFWSLFGRHSNVKEHRQNSKYPFYESCFPEIQRKSVKDLLVKLFSNTIRSSAKNRFASTESVAVILKSIIEMLSQKEVINTYEVFTKEFFVGRNNELEYIEKKLLNHKIIFVSGVPGIGKSEVVKRYVNSHKEKYKHILYWFYEGDFEKMVCSDYSVSISNFSRNVNETDTEYSMRKLKKLSELVDENALMVIDNLDVLVEDINCPELWNKLKAFPGKMIITTRCEQKNYESIKISEIKDTNILKEIFYKHCPSSCNIDVEVAFVDKIIEMSNRHTYEIELLAAHAEAEKKLPSELLEDMKRCGIGSFDKTQIHILKDGIDVTATFKDHLQKIFSLNNLSVEQKRLLLKLAFIPNAGVDIRQFKLFYSITDYNDLNWLIKHGLAYEVRSNNCTISIHPSIAEMTVNLLKTDRETINAFYDDAFRFMRKGYDDESVNKEFLLKLYSNVKDAMHNKKIVQAYKNRKLDDEELKNKFDEIIKEFDDEYAKSDVERQSYIMICNAIAYNSLHYQIKEEATARFLTQYVQWFMKYGQHESQRELLQYARNIYDAINPDDYFYDREYMYDIYVMLLLKREKYAEEALNIAKIHLKKAIKTKDWSFANNWCTNISIAYTYMDEQASSVKYSIRGLFYSIRSIWFSRKKKFENSFMTDSYTSVTRSSRLNEKDYEECVDFANWSIFALKTAIYLRESKEDSHGMSANKLKIYSDRAKIKMLQYNFAGAKEEMTPIWEAYKKGEINSTEALYESIELLGEISEILSEYDNALNYYEECLKMAEDLEYQETSRIKVRIGRIYNLWNKYELSMNYNDELLKELEEKDIEASKVTLADAYYNNAEIHWLKQNADEAMLLINKAKEVYSTHERWRNHCKIGKARCLVLEAQILLKKNNEEGHSLLQSALEILESILGEAHPEVVLLKNKI